MKVAMTLLAASLLVPVAAWSQTPSASVLDGRITAAASPSCKLDSDSKPSNKMWTCDGFNESLTGQEIDFDAGDAQKLASALLGRIIQGNEFAPSGPMQIGTSTTASGKEITYAIAHGTISTNRSTAVIVVAVYQSSADYYVAGMTAMVPIGDHEFDTTVAQFIASLDFKDGTLA